VSCCQIELAVRAVIFCSLVDDVTEHSHEQEDGTPSHTQSVVFAEPIALAPVILIEGLCSSKELPRFIFEIWTFLTPRGLGQNIVVVEISKAILAAVDFWDPVLCFPLLDRPLRSDSAWVPGMSNVVIKRR